MSFFARERLTKLGLGWRQLKTVLLYSSLLPARHFHFIAVMTTCQHLSANLWSNELFDSPSARKTEPKPNQNRVSILHKDFFPRRTLSASPPNSTQSSVAKLPVSRLPKTRPSSPKTTYNTTYRAALPYKRSSIKASHLQRNFSC